MRILGIESSCDESAVAIVEDGTRILSNVIGTVSDAFAATGGVIPESAAREQVKLILPVLGRALEEAKVTWEQIDAIAVTRGPGLLGSLLTGTMTARALASVHQKPLIGVHHTLAHLSSTFLGISPHESPHFPILSLTVSGGHTDLWLRTAHTEGRLLGCTRDDAAGEAFDKGAVLLGLPYPGGPSIATAAEQGNPRAFPFPKPLHDAHSLEFSFSGLKTSLRYLVRDLVKEGRSLSEPQLISDIAASYQEAICRHLTDRLLHALAQEPNVREINLTGGVSRNEHLRRSVQDALHNDPTITIRWPGESALCTDNAAMVAAAGFFMIREKGADAYEPFKTEASTPLDLL